MQRRNRSPNVSLQALFCIAMALWLSGCGSPPLKDHATDAVSDLHPPQRQHLLAVAIDQIGTPYRYGGNSQNGFDCSGLVQYSHARIGIDVPRTTAAQWRSGRKIDRSQLEPGDLLFFAIGPEKNRHVAIYEGQGSFIHAPSSGKTVSRASLDNPYWRRRLTGGRSFF
jgi:cell wall-associated NlpC family hydrolase